MNLKKRIELTRIGNILIYFAKNTKNLGVTKANKLIYYLDCYHLLEYGRTITRDKYYKLPEGPVPSDTYRRLTSIREIEQPEEGLSKDITQNFHEFLAEYIKISVDKISKDVTIYRIISKQKFQPKWFSKSELKILHKIATNFNDATAKQLSEMTHRELPYISAEDSEILDLKLFLKDKGLPQEKINEVIDIENTIKSMELNYHCDPDGILQLT